MPPDFDFDDDDDDDDDEVHKFEGGLLAMRYGMVLMLIAGVAMGQDTIQVKVDTEKKPWTHLEVNNNPDQFQFAIVTDRTGGHRPGVFMDGVRKLNLLQPEFVMSVGDLIEGYTEDLEQIDREWNEFIGFVEKLEMPFFYVPGNHDLSNEVMVAEWKKRFGALWYHFVYKDVLFLCLDSEDPPNTQMSMEQAAYVEAALKQHPDVRWTLVFMHKPMWNRGQDSQGWQKIEQSLQGRPYTMFAGHTHNYYKQVRHDAQYITLATMGGGSQLRGPNFGQFDHFLWVTMTEEGPRMASLMLDGIWDTNIITDERLALIRPLVGGAAVRTDGIVIDRDEFERAETKLRLTNDADLPMHIALTVPQRLHLKPSTGHLETTIAPNSVEIVDLAFEAQSTAKVDETAPVTINYTATYAPEGHLHPVRVRGVHRVVFDSEYKLGRKRGVTVDGDLSEWGDLPIVPVEPGHVQDDTNAWQGNGDASARFGVRYDRDNLYVAVAVMDDHNVRNERRNFQRQDSLVVSLDARPADQRSGDGGTLHIPVVAGEDQVDGGEGDGLPEGVAVASEMTDEGYVVEVAIPVSYVEKMQGADWETVRVNWTIYDFDPDGNARVSWRPVWSSPANYAQSGTFAR